MLYFFSKKCVDEYTNKLVGNTLWIPLLSDHNAHYIQNRLSSVYVYSLDTEDEYVIGFNSVDIDPIDPHDFFSRILPGNRLAYHAKYLWEYGFDCHDANLLIWYYNGHGIDEEQPSRKIFGLYKSWYPSIRNVVDVVPIMRSIEFFRDIRNIFLQYYTLPNDDGHRFYERIHRRVLVPIEHSGIRIAPESSMANSPHLTSDGMMYTEFNPYTITGRPSSGAARINLNSLNKEDGTRRMIISRHPNGRLVEFDYDSYHIRLIAKLIGFDLPSGNLHEYFAKQYFGNVDITPEIYDRSKRLTFRQVYGTIADEYLDIPFYKAIAEYIDRLWDQSQVDEYFSSPLSGRKFMSRWYKDMSKTKMFSYIIQAFETELNMLILDEIIAYLYHMKSLVIMYTYDAVLIDFNPSDGSEVLKGIAAIMGKFGYPVKVSAGENYHDMVRVTI